jgi:hypothetical protein
MAIRQILERGQRHLERIHLAVWIIEVLTSASLSGLWAYASGFPWPLVALTTLGGVVAITLIIVLFYELWLWLPRFIHGRFKSRGISIVLGSTAPFDTYKTGLHKRYHTIKIGLVNNSQLRALTNCQLTLENITGMLTDKCPVPIKTGFILNPGAYEYVELVGLSESGSDVAFDQSGPKFEIRAYFPINPLRSDQSSWLDHQPYTLTLLATAAESPSCRLVCRLFVEKGVLQLKVV